MVQAVWSTAHGRPLESTLSTGEQAVRLGGHVDPILVLFAPLWLVAPTPLLLAGAQVAAVALGAVPVHRLARRHLESEAAAALLALTYLAYPWLTWTALDAFHPVTLAIPLLLFCVYFLDSHRLAPFVLCALLALATNELAGLFVAALGAWYALARSRRVAGLTIATAGTAWTLVCLTIVVPAFGTGGNPFYAHYASVGGSPSGLAKTLVTDPGAIAGALTSTRDVAYVLWLVLPLLATPLLAPLTATLALPQLAVNMLADLGTATDPRHHYIAGAVPFLFAASAFGLARLPVRARLPTLAAMLGANVVLSLTLSPLPGLGGPTRGFQMPLPPERVDALRAAVALVPEDAPVTTTNRAASHLAARRQVYLVPVLRNASWVVIDARDPYMGIAGSLPEGPHPEVLRRFHERLRRSAAWEPVFAREDVYVYRRTGR